MDVGYAGVVAQLAAIEYAGADALQKVEAVGRYIVFFVADCPKVAQQPLQRQGGSECGVLPA